MNSRLARRAFCVVVALVATASSALAEESADALKARGNQAMMDLNYVEALSAYRAALEKNPGDVALFYNIGRAHQARGDYPSALDALVTFEQKAPVETKAKVPGLSSLVADIRSHVGELSIRCSLDVVKSTVVVGELAKLDGCTTQPKTVRVSLASKLASVEVRLESDAFQAPSAKVTIEGGAGAVNVVLEASPKSNNGVLRVTATPAVAVVSVDGAAKGNPPVELVVAAGSHVVDVHADAYEHAHVPLVMEAGGRKELNLTLEKTPPITKRWWFWAGAGAVAAGVATVCAILIVQPEREPSRGTIDPGVIRAPLGTF